MNEIYWTVTCALAAWTAANYIKIKTIEKRAIQKSVDELTLDIMRTKLPAIQQSQPEQQEQPQHEVTTEKSSYFG